MQRLAEREHGEAALAQLRVSEHARVLEPVINDVLVDLVREHVDVPVANYVGELVEIFWRGGRARRVVRRVDDDEPRAIGDGRGDAIPVVPERRRHQRNVNAPAAREPHGGVVRIVRRDRTRWLHRRARPSPARRNRSPPCRRA